MSIRDTLGLIQISDTASPKTLSGEQLDVDCLHCQLALPIQHFMDKHPQKSREDIVKEMAEAVAELVASCGDWAVVTTYRDAVMDYLPQIIRAKWESYQRYQRNRV